MKVLIIPDIHLKPYIFSMARDIMESGAAQRAVCMMDIADDFGQERNIDLYIQTYQAAIDFALAYPDTLWCWGNHDLAYLWDLNLSGHSRFAASTVCYQLRKLQEATDKIAFVHRIDEVLFLHGGLSERFVKRYCADEYDGHIDSVIKKINEMGPDTMWNDDSPIWFRPQVYGEPIYRGKEFLQVVGHTPVKTILQEEHILSTDTFSTYRDGSPYGDQKFCVVDTETKLLIK